MDDGAVLAVAAQRTLHGLVHGLVRAVIAWVAHQALGRPIVRHVGPRLALCLGHGAIGSIVTWETDDEIVLGYLRLDFFFCPNAMHRKFKLLSTGGFD